MQLWWIIHKKIKILAHWFVDCELRKGDWSVPNC